MRWTVTGVFATCLITGCASGVATNEPSYSPQFPVTEVSGTYRVEVRSQGSLNLLFLQKPESESLEVILQSRGRIEKPTISADGEFAAYLSGEFNQPEPALFVQDVATGRRVLICEINDPALVFGWSIFGLNMEFESKGQRYEISSAEILKRNSSTDEFPFCIDRAVTSSRLHQVP